MLPLSLCRLWQPDRAANAAQDTRSYTTARGTIHASAWFNEYGPVAWVGSGLLGLLVFFGIYALWADARLFLANATAVRKWQDTIETINPLDSEFTRRRINSNDLRNPITGRVIGKKFIDCQFIGPANLLFLSHNYVHVEAV